MSILENRYNEIQLVISIFVDSFFIKMQNKIVLYTTSKGKINIQVQFEDSTFWLTQKRIAELFGVDVRTINEHLQNIF